MAARKAIGKKTRFEIFKRDNFTCQYCGKSAPNVILHIDHIIPVAEGGKNHITNLITSCAECNLGKGAVSLSDNSVVEKQKRQLEEINERREQLKLMCKWREELSKFEDEKLDYIDDRICDLCGYSLSDSGRKNMRKTIKKFDYSLILDSIEKSAIQYLKKDKDGAYTDESAEKFINYIPKICNGILIQDAHPEFKEINYIKGIMRNRFSYYDAAKATKILREAYENGVDLVDIRELAKEARDWSWFMKDLQRYQEGEL